MVCENLGDLLPPILTGAWNGFSQVIDVLPDGVC